MLTSAAVLSSPSVRLKTGNFLIYPHPPPLNTTTRDANEHCCIVKLTHACNERLTTHSYYHIRSAQAGSFDPIKLEHSTPLLQAALSCSGATNGRFATLRTRRSTSEQKERLQSSTGGMAPRTNHVIELSDDSDHGVVARGAPAARPKPGNKSSRSNDNRPVSGIIDLTDDSNQHSDSHALPKRSRASSPATKSMTTKVRNSVPPLPVQKTEMVSAKSEDASPVLPPVSEDTGLSDGLTAKASALRLSSSVKPRSLDANANGHKPSLKKRRRDDESTQRPNAPTKHRRVATNGDGDEPASFRKAIPRESVTSAIVSSRLATNSPTRGGATNDENASKKSRNLLAGDVFDSPSTRLTPRPSNPTTVVRDSQDDSRQSSPNFEEPSSERTRKPNARHQPKSVKTARTSERSSAEHFEDGLSTFLKRNGESKAEAAQKKSPGPKALDFMLSDTLNAPDADVVTQEAEAGGSRVDESFVTSNDGRVTRPPAMPLRKASIADSASAGASPSSQLLREAAGEDRERFGDGEQALQHKTTQSEPHTNHDFFDAAPIVVPDLSMFPVERQVERILGKYYQEMREDIDYSTKLQLKRSRRSAELHMDKQAGSGKPSVASSVFARLRASAVMQPTTSSAKIGDGNVKFNVDVYHGAANRSTRIYTKVKTVYCDATSLANDVPEYAHYVSLKSNVLAPNTKTMTVWPYFGDGAPDPEEFEDNYFMDTDQRHRKIRRILEAQKVEEYIESALRDLQISWDDVLRFLLDARPDVGKNAAAQTALKKRESDLEDFPRVGGSKKWMKVLSSLSSSTTDKLIKAAILCDNFQSMAKFPLWHVARRSAAVKKAFESQDPPASSIESRTCRLCFQFNCHQHGELRESHSDTDSGVETDDAVSKDVLYPPRVNFRKRVTLPHRPPVSKDEGSSLALVRKKMTPKYWDSSLFTKPGEWPPFYPCCHAGLTCTQAECSCFLDKRPCEKSCECSDDCTRKFKGCACFVTGKRTVCWRDERCTCYNLGRECDADLCGSCGVCELLDPVHRHVDGDSRKRCSNASIQKGVPKHTLLGDSGVHGMGLYAGEHVKKHEFVGEYKGEVITNGEADRRGAVYEKQNSTYLFSLNTKQEVDSNFYGNKIRFINHRNRAGANLYPLIVLVNSVHRIGLFAQHDIKPGEELFFDYGPKFPEHLLGGTKQAVSKSAPHVRNSNLLEQFYDIQDEEDEEGNVRARKAPANSKRARARKTEPVAKPVKVKGKMGGARPGAGRKPGKKRADAAASSRGSKAAISNEVEEDEISRVMNQDRFETYYVSQDLGLGAGADDDDDEDFVVGAGASELESSEDEEESDFGDDEFEDSGRGRRVRKRAWKLDD